MPDTLSIIVSVCLAAGTVPTLQEDDGHPPFVQSMLDQSAELSTAELVQVTRALQRLLESRLLEPDTQALNRYPELVDGKDSGVSRLLDRNAAAGLVTLPGGGAFFSWETKSNSYQEAPDVGLEQWRLRTGFYGGNTGIIAQLPIASITRVSLQDVPQQMRDAKATELQRRLDHSADAVKPGQVYAVRAVRFGEADTIAVMEILDSDAYGITFAWKVLKRFGPPAR
ncbi:MAG: hypothetical protein ACYTGC_06735 [Planctomycetota bacterium]|jgi:hypothetical protein